MTSAPAGELFSRAKVCENNSAAMNKIIESAVSPNNNDQNRSNIVEKENVRITIFPPR